MVLVMPVFALVMALEFAETTSGALEVSRPAWVAPPPLPS
jgi:hypothetical protein